MCVFYSTAPRIVIQFENSVKRKVTIFNLVNNDGGKDSLCQLYYSINFPILIWRFKVEVVVVLVWRLTSWCEMRDVISQILTRDSKNLVIKVLSKLNERNWPGTRSSSSSYELYRFSEITSSWLQPSSRRATQTSLSQPGMRLIRI